MLQEFVAMAGAESYRGAQEDPEKRKYPGGAFDPMGAPPTAAPVVQQKFILCTDMNSFHFIQF